MDRLGPEYEAGKPYYLLTLSVAFATAPANTGEVLNTLKPWEWPAVTTLSVYKQAAGAGAWTGVPHKLLPAAVLTNTAALRAALGRELDEQLKEFQPGDFTWDPTSAAPPPAWSGRKGRDWRSFVAHVGSYPGGIATTLNLAFVFVPDAAPDPADVVLAAPHVSVGGVTLKPADPAGASQPLKPVTDQTGLYQWGYEGDAAAAFLNKPDAPVADMNSYINIQTLWRNDHDLEGGGDWTRGLEDRLAQSFDGVERLMEWLRGQKGGAAIPADFNGAALRAMFEVTRGAIDSSRRPPKGVALWELPKRADGSLPDVKPVATIPAAWRKMLADSLAKAAGETVKLPEVPPKPEAGLAEFRDDWAQLQGLFRRDEALVEIILLLWDAYFGAALKPEVRDKLREELGRIAQLHQNLLLHAAGDTWRSLVPAGVAAGGEWAAARDTVEKALTAFKKSLWAAGDKAWDDLFEAQLRRVMLKPEDIPADITSDGILIQVDKVEVNPAGDALAGKAADPVRDRQDYLRKITGVGVLLKKEGGPWRCLNMARLFALQADGLTHEKVDDMSKAVPYRFAYESGLRQGFVRYENQPLIARSPWADLSPSRELRPTSNGNGTTPAALDRGLLSYASPYGDKEGIDSGWRLERLVYGERYRVAPFYIANGGALPAKLAAASAGGSKLPWQFALPATGDALPGEQPVEFLRGCAVGPLRIAESAKFPPELPAHVYPIARIVEKPEAKTPPEKADEHRTPLLLLLPSDTTGWNVADGHRAFDFSVRPPALDVKVWDRWIRDDTDLVNTPNLKRRKRVIGRVHDLRRMLDAGLLREADPSLDDPAVVGFKVLGKCLWPVDKEFKSDLSPRFKERPQPPAQAPPDPEHALDAEQKFPVPVRVQSANVAAPKFDLINVSGSDLYVLSVPDGEVWRFDFQPVFADGAAGRFEQKGATQLSPLSFVVEVAQPLLKGLTSADAAKALHTSLTLERPMNEPGLLRVGLNADAFPAFAPLVHRVELVTQRWRWDGRPAFELPLTTPPRSGIPFSKFGELDDSFEGDGMLFSARDEADASVFPTQVEFADGEMPRRATLRDIGWSDKPGVLYYRFHVRAFSRYEGLLERTPSLDSSEPEQEGGARRWKRYARECQWRQRVPKPLVKLVLPLTQSVGTVAGAKGAAGWLVVLDESWYGESMAGLGELLQSEIMTVRLPDDPDERRQQFGPDPTVETPAEPPGGFKVELPRPVGAIGSTFDTVTEAPFFARSAFLQPPPVHTSDEAAPDLSFYFVKLRFKRVLAGVRADDPRSMVGAPESEYTDGYWTQVLPPSDWWRVDEAGDRVHVKDLKFVPGTGFTWRGQGATILPTGPNPQPASSVNRFQLFGLVTRKVTDAFGREGQETFAGLWSLAKLKTVGIGAGGVVRLVEVQFRLRPNDPLPVPDTDESLEKLADALFPKGGAEEHNDAQGRIVRVSPPFRIV